MREAPALVLLLVIIAWMFLFKSTFRSLENIGQIGQQAGILGIMACGEALVILTGGVDLSVGAIAAMAACVAGGRMSAGMPWQLAVICGLGAGLAGGWINGALITYRKLPPILTTLATLLGFRAFTNIITGAVPYTPLSAGFGKIASSYGPIVSFVLVVVVLATVLARVRFGRRIVAIGCNEQAVRLSGISTDAVIRRVYLLSGLLAGAAGILISGASNSAQWNIADGYELNAIAAVVIGGVRLSGGEGSIIGAALGAIILVTMQKSLFLYGRPQEQYGLVIGAVILLAAFAEQFRRFRESKN